MRVSKGKRCTAGMAALFGAALLLTGCGGGGGSDDGAGGMYGGGGQNKSEAEKESSSGTDLAVAKTELGDVVVDSKGMTLYLFTSDDKGTDTSACTAECLDKWPMATTINEKPTLKGVTGEVGTIAGAEGSRQLTLNGMPLYTFAEDAKPGDTTGQGVGGLWFAVAPDGTMIR